jgi:hypothetical protein
MSNVVGLRRRKPYELDNKNMVPACSSSQVRKISGQKLRNREANLPASLTVFPFLALSTSKGVELVLVYFGCHGGGGGLVRR